MSVDEMKKMKKLFEMMEPGMAPEMEPDMAPEDQMDYDAPPGAEAPEDMDDAVLPDVLPDEGGANVIDELDSELKQITSDYLQVDGPLDTPEHSDMRKKLSDNMKKILDELHAEWMADMMDDNAHDASEDSDDAPLFSLDDDGDEEEKDDSEEPASDDSDKDDSDKDDSDKDDSDKDDDSGDSDDSDGDKEDDFPFKEAHLNESRAVSMRKLMETINKG